MDKSFEKLLIKQITDTNPKPKVSSKSLIFLDLFKMNLNDRGK